MAGFTIQLLKFKNEICKHFLIYLLYLQKKALMGLYHERLKNKHLYFASKNRDVDEGFCC